MSVVETVAAPPLAYVVPDAAVGVVFRPVAIVDRLTNNPHHPIHRPLNQFDFYNPAEVGSYSDTSVPLADDVRERWARDAENEFDAYSTETTNENNDN